ncbi:MAG: DUF6503 family protein [Myxococcota bacterium]
MWPLIAATLLGASPSDTVARAQRVHGSDTLKHAHVVFSFRGTRYEMDRDQGQYVYTSLSNDKRITLTNSGVTLTVSGRPIPMTDNAAQGAAETVNSVVYFASLPLALSDPAVHLADAGLETVRSQDYERVRVTFTEQDGGADHDDVFMYWFRVDTGTMDYFAYSYRRDGGGIRFRVTTAAQLVDGMRFQDYDNYQTKVLSTPLDSLPRLWAAGKLEKLSEIKTEDVCVITAKRSCR